MEKRAERRIVRQLFPRRVWRILSQSYLVGLRLCSDLAQSARVPEVRPGRNRSTCRGKAGNDRFRRRLRNKYGSVGVLERWKSRRIPPSRPIRRDNRRPIERERGRLGLVFGG